MLPLSKGQLYTGDTFLGCQGDPSMEVPLGAAFLVVIMVVITLVRTVIQCCLFSYSLSRALLNSMPLPGRNCDNWTIKMSQVSLNTASILRVALSLSR